MVKRQHHTSNHDEWLQLVANKRGQKDQELLDHALSLYPEQSSSQISKGLKIADVLLTLGLDTETLAAALIYPAVQSSLISLDKISEELDIASSNLLHDVLQLQSIGQLQNIELKDFHQIENLRKMLLSMVTDVRAVLIILAERLWLLHDAKNLPTAQQQQLAQETLDVFAPLANRLGVWQIKWEMEDLCLRYLKPQTYSDIAKWLASKRAEREAYIENMIKLVSDTLSTAQIQDFQITGRVKHIYSIYRKMQRKNSSFEDIYDISALRVLVPEVDDCYHVLSVLQNTWPHVLKEFDDYISQPKPNGYRSLHTVLLGPLDHYVEVQIRTYQMHQESELGVAAHWQYKEGVLQPSSYDAKIALLRQVMAWQKELVGANAKPELSHDLFDDQVYVFTPMGDIIALPKGATPLDFAYTIHSEVGHRCRGAKVNGNIVPLTYKLHTGARVEILTAKHATPSRDWLNPHSGYLFTSRARAKAQHWFRVKDSQLNIQAGRELLEKELKKINYTDKIDLDAWAPKFNLKTGDDLLAALSMGEVRITHLIHYLRPVPHPLPEQIIPLRPSSLPAGTSTVQVPGIKNLLTQIAQCCKPLPGDQIIGYVTRVRGISIHRADCKNINKPEILKQDRLIQVDWGSASKRQYPVDIMVRCHDRSGLLRDVTTILASEKINLVGLQTQKDHEPEVVDICLTIEIDNRQALQRSIDLLKNVANVIEVYRR